MKTDKKIIAELIYERLKDKDLQGITSLLSKEFAEEKTDRFEITKTPLLISTGQELGKFMLKDGWKFQRLKDLWELSLSAHEKLSQGLLSGREIRLIVIGALSTISKKEYEGSKGLVLRILKTLQDWESCDQMALRVIVNLALQNREDIFSCVEEWIKSENKWIRRLAVATIPPYIRARKDDAKVCLGFLTHVMKEKDRDVRKAIGWALREISKKDENMVFDFLKKWAERADKSTGQLIKEGMKKLPPARQEELRSYL